MLGTARLLGQSTGAALVALMLNQFLAIAVRIFAARGGDPATRGGSERFTYYATTRSDGESASFDALFILCQWAYYFRYSPLRKALQCVYPAGGCVTNSSLNDFDLPLIQNAIMLAALRLVAGFQALQRSNHFFTVNQLRRSHRHETHGNGEPHGDNARQNTEDQFQHRRNGEID